MKVIWKGKTDCLVLTNGKTYNVISIEKGWYRIIDDSGEGYLYPPDNFEIVREQAHYLIWSNETDNVEKITKDSTDKKGELGHFMTIDEFKKHLISEAVDLHFDYNGFHCGIEQFTENRVMVFALWYGDIYKKFSTLDELVEDKVYNGKSFSEILNDVEIFYD